MAKARYLQKGMSIDYVNSGGSDIAANTIVTIGKHIGIAGEDIAPGEMGSLVTEGVFVFPKGDADIALGDDVYYNDTSGQITKENTDTPVGYAVEAAGTGKTEILVKLKG